MVGPPATPAGDEMPPGSEADATPRSMVLTEDRLKGSKGNHKTPQISKTERSKSPLLERHELFSSTVVLAGSRLEIPRSGVLDYECGTSMAPHSAREPSRPSTWGGSTMSWGGAPTGWRNPPGSARVQKEESESLNHSDSFGVLRDSRTDLQSSLKSNRSSVKSKASQRSQGVPIRHWTLPRTDGIPNAVTGQRQAAPEGDNLIRVFIRLPAGDRFALWVPPDMPVGPLAAPPSPVLPEKDERARGGRQSPFKSLLAEKSGEVFIEPVTFDSLNFGFDSSCLGESFGDFPAGSLKDMIQSVFGIPADLQKLVIGRRGPLTDPKKPIYQYDVGHGALLYLTIKKHGDRVMHLASPALKSKLEETHSTDAMYESMGSFRKSTLSCGTRTAKELVEPLPDWRVPLDKKGADDTVKSSELFYQDYTFLRDNHIFDLAGRIRKRFGAANRVAVQQSAPEKLEAAVKKLPRHVQRNCPVTGRKKSLMEMKTFGELPSSPDISTRRQSRDKGVYARRDSRAGRETLEWAALLNAERQLSEGSSTYGAYQ